MNEEAELRVRYVSPYNFLIAPKGNPINNIMFDNRRAELLNAILRGQNNIDTLVGEILALPKKDL